ncbi:MAG: hypothetical protein ACOX9C_02155 [Kiritimatiellia bacterium]|jgi:hypothetical protein
MRVAVFVVAGSVGVLAALGASADMARLELRDGSFVNPDGTTERFWGVNLVSAFPAHDEAEALADNLASLGVNLVRPHHLMRPGKDWVWRAPCAALATYENDSRTPDAVAWDRFDHLNAALRKRGIRLALSLHWSRKFLPGDAAIDPVGDAEEWVEAVREINEWPWQKSIDPVKLLPVVDRRARLLQKEFASTLLSHRNPYTGKTYGDDAQILYLELVNESSLEYALICGNTFPDYFERQLQDAWRRHAKKSGVESPANLREVNGPDMLALRSAFFRAFEDDYFRDMRSHVEGLGSRVPIVCCNLWRGDDVLAANAKLGDLVEDHLYVDPLVVREAGSWVDRVAQTHVAGKPYVLGEFNFTENQAQMKQVAFARPMLMVSAAAYGAFHGVDGIVWFAYNHGDRNLGEDGWAKAEQRLPALGDLVTDGVMLDHMATCSALFRSGALKASAKPQVCEVAVPVHASNYNALMAGIQLPFAGAQSVHAHRKRFVQAGAASAKPPASGTSAAVFASDTGEIVRDTAKRQLCVAAPAVEAFSGFLDAGFPTRFSHLSCTGTNGFATVVVVAMDGKALGESRNLRISRTWMNEAGEDLKGLGIVMTGLRALEGGGSWTMRVHRPRGVADVLNDLTGSDGVALKPTPDGMLVLPTGTWNQIELRF